MMEIYTLICNNETESKIQAVIAERIINPVKTELGLNLFKYDEDDIMGMIFFLTGNCHIKWTAIYIPLTPDKRRKFFQVPFKRFRCDPPESQILPAM